MLAWIFNFLLSSGKFRICIFLWQLGELLLCSVSYHFHPLRANHNDDIQYMDSCLCPRKDLSVRIADISRLILECIRRFYSGIDSLLYDTLRVYKGFFAVFLDYNGYVHFFLLEDLVDRDGSVRFFLPFDGFCISFSICQYQWLSDIRKKSWSLFMQGIEESPNMQNYNRNTVMSWIVLLCLLDTPGYIELFSHFVFLYEDVSISLQ